MPINRSENARFQSWQHHNGAGDPQTAGECCLVRRERAANTNKTGTGNLSPHLRQSFKQHIDAFSRYGCSDVQKVVRPPAAKKPPSLVVSRRVGFWRATRVNTIADDGYAFAIDEAVSENLVSHGGAWTGDPRGFLQTAEDVLCHCAKGTGSFFPNGFQHAAESIQIMTGHDSSVRR